MTVEESTLYFDEVREITDQTWRLLADLGAFGNAITFEGKRIPLKEFYMPTPAANLSPEVLIRLAVMSDSDKELAMVYADAMVDVECRRCIAIVTKGKKTRAKDFRAIIDEMRNRR